MVSLCVRCVTIINPQWQDRLREHVLLHLGYTCGQIVFVALKDRLVGRLHLTRCFICPCILAEFIPCNTTNISSWRNSADVFELEPHTANDGRNRDGYSHDGRRANTGSASGNTRDGRSDSCARNGSCGRSCGSSSAHVERRPHGHQRLHRRLLQLQCQPS